MKDNRQQAIQTIFSNNGPVLRSKQLRSFGISSRNTQELIDEAGLIRLKEGYYVWHDQLQELTDAQIAVSVIPGATIYFLSAAEHYGLTTVIPQRVYVSVLNRGTAPTKPSYPPIEISRLSQNLYNLGRTTTETIWGRMPIYDLEKTICDLAKRRDEVGKDILIQAIRSYLRGPRDLQKLHEYAEIMRVRQKIHPYVEAMV